MRTIALSCNKGGVGKTSISKHIATAAAASGLNVMLLDMDTQQNATNWGRRRSMRGGAMGVPVVRFVTENDLPETLERASAAGCDLVVIDTPPGRSAEAPAAVEASDIVLIPFWLEKDAFDGVQRTAALASRMGKPAFGVLNFATPNSQIHIEAARDSLERLGVPMSPAVLHRYEVYRMANLPGLTVQEMEPGSRAAIEIAGLWDWLSTRAIVHNGACAIVHNGAVQHDDDEQEERGVPCGA